MKRRFFGLVIPNEQEFKQHLSAEETLGEMTTDIDAKGEWILVARVRRRRKVPRENEPPKPAHTDTSRPHTPLPEHMPRKESNRKGNTERFLPAFLLKKRR